MDSLLDLLPEQTSKKRMSSCTLKEAYVSKMVKVNDSDRWSLIALGNNKTNSVELKFVDRMKRKFEFSVDSFHIMLDTLFLFYDCARMDIRSKTLEKEKRKRLQNFPLKVYFSARTSTQLWLGRASMETLVKPSTICTGKKSQEKCFFYLYLHLNLYKTL